MTEQLFRRHREKVPFGIRFLQWIGSDRNRMYRMSVLILTFFAYTTYHLSRKTISVVKGTLSSNCSVGKPIHPQSADHDGNMTVLTSACHGWHPFDSDEGSELLGALDLAFLFSYAIGMFISGFIAEHMDIRLFLTIGMLSSGACSMVFGFGYFWRIHNFAFFVTVQIFFGFFQSSGWPSVVECVGNWFGKGRRGLIMGIWNSHTSVGNILGSAIPGIWASNEWGWSFIVPGIIIAAMGIVVFLFLVVDPLHVSCAPPEQHPTPSSPDHGIKSTRQYSNGSVTEETESLLNGSSSQSSDSLTPVKNGEASVLFNESSSEECMSVGINRRVPPITVLSNENPHAVGFIKALSIPGVIEYSLCLFFAKLVSYTFLFWLPFYLEHTKIGGRRYGPETSADLSTFFDAGGIVGGILAGVISDKTNCSGIPVVVMLFLAGPMLFIYRFLANANLHLNVFLMFLSGILVNGPYALITTAVSANLGTHECLHGNTKAMATVTAIIDGTGSMGAALGPLLTGIISPTGWNNVYYMLIAADVFAAVLLSRQVWFEISSFSLARSRRKNKMLSRMGRAYNSIEDGGPKQK